MELFIAEITRAELFYPLPASPPVATQICPLIKRTDLTCRVCFRAMRKEETFPAQNLSAQHGVIYTEPPTDKELKTDSISLRHTSLADNPVQ